MNLASETTVGICIEEQPRHFALRLKQRQVLLVLAGFPALYLVNSFTPWSIGLFGRGDRTWSHYFAVSVLVLHWSTTFVMIAQVYRAGGTLSDLGLRLSAFRVVVAVLVFAAAGSGMLWLRHALAATTWPIPAEPPSGWQAIYPFTWSERVMMLFLATTAGICEELIYRGYALRVLAGRGMKVWLALLLSGLSFSLVHGLAGAFLLPVFLIVHLLFAMIFLWRKSLWPVIYVHVLWDMMMVLAV
jgi:membrane protease YdiL (CAAX protease family)